MGASKRQLEQENVGTGHAVELLEGLDFLSECEACGELTHDGVDPEDACEKANLLFSQKDPLVSKFATKEEMNAAIERALDILPMECHCESVYQNDPS